MLSAKDLFQRRSVAGGRTFLKVSDLPRGTRNVQVEVRDIREAPRAFQSPLIVDIGVVYVGGNPVQTEKTSLPINISNMSRMVECLGHDDLSAVHGMFLDLDIESVRNPQAQRGDPDEFVYSFKLRNLTMPITQNPEPDPPSKKDRKKAA